MALPNILGKLSYLLETKSAIADAIEECEVTVPEDASFFSFGALIRQIHGAFNKNKRTGAREYSRSDSSPGGSVGYSTDSTATSGHPDATTGTEPVSKALIVTTLNEPYVMTPQKWSQEHNGEQCDGFSSVTIDLTGLPPGDETEKTVQFYADTSFTGEVLYETKVPMFGTAHFGGEYPTKSGERFTGWSPNPINVTSDMKVGATFSSEALSVNTSDTLPNDDWETICANGGRGYALGAHKELRISGFQIEQKAYEVNNGQVTEKDLCKTNDIPEIVVNMYKVAEGEDGTDSTWVGLANIGGGNSVLNTSGTGGYYDRTGISTYGWACTEGTDMSVLLHHNPNLKICHGWHDSFAREVLNSKVFEGMPTCLKKAIRPVVKYTPGYANAVGDNPGEFYGPILLDIQTIDLIWPASLREALVANPDSVTSSIYEGTMATKGVLYRDKVNSNLGIFAGVSASSLAIRDRILSRGARLVTNSSQITNMFGSFYIGFCISATGGNNNAGNNGESNNSEEPETPEGDQNGNS